MKIGVLGAGNVGGTLGARWGQAGHTVKFGVRNPQSDSVTELVQKGEGRLSAGTSVEAVAFADVVVFAIPYSSLESVAREIGGFGDKVLIDATNPVSEDFSGLSLSNTSASEQLAQWTGSPKVVKCFNTVGYNIMADPNFNGTPASMLYCGDDPQAKQLTAQLATDLGFSPVDAGPLDQAALVENLAWLWISMAIKYDHGREMAFVLHKR